MAELLDDMIDFGEYMRDTEPASKVRPASAFAADIVAEFAEREHGARKPEMFSTKLRDRIEGKNIQIEIAQPRASRPPSRRRRPSWLRSNRASSWRS